MSFGDNGKLKAAIATSFIEARTLEHNFFKVELAQRVRSARSADRGSSRMNAIGEPISRSEGRLKVTGAVHYTGDITIVDALHASIVSTTIANGRTVSIDTSAAEKAPGVFRVFTYRNMPRMNPTPKPWSHLHPHGQSYLPLQDDQIHYAGQPIALVVADTLDRAAYAGTLIRVECEEQPPIVFGPQSIKDAFDPPQFLWPVASSVGDAKGAIAASPVKIERTYTTSDRHHNQMEPHATTASWDPNGVLTLYETTQHIFGAKNWCRLCLVCHWRRSTLYVTSWAEGSAERLMFGRIPSWRPSPPGS